MRDLSPPFRFDFRSLLKAWRRKLNTRIDGVSISLPFLSFKVNATDLEQRVAREVLIRMANRRVLSASECCDNCIDQALESLQGIRAILEQQQVALVQAMDSPLYLLLELQLEAIRQFLTFEQRLNAKPVRNAIVLPRGPDTHRSQDKRKAYFAALEMLRAHLHRCLLQVAKIAGVTVPKFAEQMHYDEAWQLDAYEKPVEIENRG
jgi:hypothetical protein